MKKIFFLLTLTVISIRNYGQLYFTKNGCLAFFSKAIFQNIDESNHKAKSVLNIQTSAIPFSFINNAFHFQKVEMEEDINEVYIKSDKYPKSALKEFIADISHINFGKDDICTIGYYFKPACIIQLI